MRRDVVDPLADIAMRRSIAATRKVAELQVIVGVDQTRQQPGALEIDDAITAHRLAADTRDAITHHAQRALPAFERGVDEAQPGRVTHGTPRRARITSTSGVPCQSR